MIRPVIVIGSGGHAKVVIEALRQSGVLILGRTDADPAKARAEMMGVPFLGDDSVLAMQDRDAVDLANGIGSTGDPARRIAVFDSGHRQGFRFARVVHPSAVVAGDVKFGEGAQVMAGAVIQPGCRIGDNAIVNTGARVDHDSDVGTHVHVAPGAILCGEVTVGVRSHVGAGAIVIQTVTIGEDCLVAAGAVLTADVARNSRVAGVPARSLSA